MTKKTIITSVVLLSVLVLLIFGYKYLKNKNEADAEAEQADGDEETAAPAISTTNTTVRRARFTRMPSSVRRDRPADPALRPIRKTRYCLTWEEQYFEIDVYPFWQDRAILEIELSDENAPIRFPKELKVLREVTEDEEYRNASLARR